ncbi:hypothetical protein [Afifella marina]|nr:hypothetical protein [Afifella marina]
MGEHEDPRDELIRILKANIEELREARAEDRKQWVELAGEQRRFHAEQLRAIEQRYKDERADDAHVLRSASEKATELAEGGGVGAGGEGATEGGQLEQLVALLKKVGLEKSEEKTHKLLMPDRREARRAIKTETSIRIFALHAVFEEVGFLDYARKKKDGQWLFPALHSGVIDPPSTASKRVNYRLKKAGIHRPRELVFHSSRHTSKDLMRIAHVDPRTIDRQTGHAPTSVGDRYGSKHLREDEIAVLAAIPLLEGLDLGPYLRRRESELEGRRKRFPRKHK